MKSRCLFFCLSICTILYPSFNRLSGLKISYPLIGFPFRDSTPYHLSMNGQLPHSLGRPYFHLKYGKHLRTSMHGLAYICVLEPCSQIWGKEHCHTFFKTIQYILPAPQTSYFWWWWWRHKVPIASSFERICHAADVIILIRNFTSKVSNFFQNVFKVSFICKGKPLYKVGYEIIYFLPLSKYKWFHESQWLLSIPQSWLWACLANI